MPISEAVAELLSGARKVADVIGTLLARPLKSEAV
jgi:hypothetical protein